jgi:hypothetical protein
MAALEFEAPCLDICLPIHFSDKSRLDQDLQKQCPELPNGRMPNLGSRSGNPQDLPDSLKFEATSGVPHCRISALLSLTFGSHIVPLRDSLVASRPPTSD